MGREGRHGDLCVEAQRARIIIVGVELVIGVVLLGIVEHHVLFDLEDIGEALGALFNLAGDQGLHIDGAAVLQLLDLGVILLGVGLFPLSPHAGIDRYKFTSSHSNASFQSIFDSRSRNSLNCPCFFWKGVMTSRCTRCSQNHAGRQRSGSSPQPGRQQDTWLC